MMNRPKIEDYFTSKRFKTATKSGYNIKFDSGLYEQALNIYIDQLENQNDVITKAYYDIINTFGKELYKREKALDKACYMLNAFAIDTECGDDEPSSPNEWKEWCMRDD